MEYQREVTPFVILVQMRVEPRQAQGDRVVTLADIGVKTVTVDHLLTRPEVLQRPIDTVGVDTVDGLSHAVLDHETEYPALDIPVYINSDQQRARSSSFYDIDGFALLIEQGHAGHAGFACTRDRADAVVRQLLLTTGVLLALGNHGTEEIHDLHG